MSDYRFSILIPTYNRTPLLELCLDRLQAVESLDVPFEVIVSDNSGGDVQAVDRAACERFSWARHVSMTGNQGQVRNMRNAAMHAQAPICVFLADDDAIIPQALLSHVRRMEEDAELVAIYTDWIAYDDSRGEEIHRYRRTDAPPWVTFDTDNPLGLVNYVFRERIHPEIGIYRREAWLRSQCVVRHGTPWHRWMYHLSRLGRIGFSMEAFYLENRLLKPGYERVAWANTDHQFDYIGEELRITLECMLHEAFGDMGRHRVDDAQELNVRHMIDGYLHDRLGLEISRAIRARDWVRGVEFAKRLALWHGPGNVGESIANLTIPACLQAIEDAYRSLAGCDGVHFHEIIAMESAFREYYPGVPLCYPATPNTLVVLAERGASTPAAAGSGGREHVLYLEDLLRQYQVGPRQIARGGDMTEKREKATA